MVLKFLQPLPGSESQWLGQTLRTAWDEETATVLPLQWQQPCVLALKH